MNLDIKVKWVALWISFNLETELYILKVLIFISINIFKLVYKLNGNIFFISAVSVLAINLMCGCLIFHILEDQKAEYHLRDSVMSVALNSRTRTQVWYSDDKFCFLFAMAYHCHPLISNWWNSLVYFQLI